MPEMSGVALAQAMVEAQVDAPILLTSSDMNVGTKSLPLGLFTAVLHKPMMREDLRRAVDQVFNKDGVVRISEQTDVVVTPDELEPALHSPPLRLLLAEDNRTNQLVFRKMIAGLNVDLTIVGNGQEAIDRYVTDLPEVIITDISMPLVDGIEATQNIRALEPQGTRIPIYALTAHAMLGDKERFLEAGMDGYLTKPLKKARIVETITSLIAARDSAQKLPV
jgi:CheY-like chemotaxis protein